MSYPVGTPKPDAPKDLNILAGVTPLHQAAFLEEGVLL